MRASSVRHAAQSIKISLVAMIVILVLGLLAISPDPRRQVLATARGLNWLSIEIGLGLLLAAIDLALLAVALVYFQRLDGGPAHWRPVSATAGLRWPGAAEAVGHNSLGTTNQRPRTAISG